MVDYLAITTLESTPHRLGQVANLGAELDDQAAGARIITGLAGVPQAEKIQQASRRGLPGH